MVSEHYECNTSCTIIYLKIYGEETFKCSYKDYSSLNKWQANWDLLSAFTLSNLLFSNNAPMKR
jgi:hypothetical protein